MNREVRESRVDRPTPSRFTEEAGGRNAEGAEGTQREQRLPLCGPLRAPLRPLR